MKALLLVLFSAWASTIFAAEKHNVLLIAIDDLRNDLGSLGVAHAKTPQLDSFAKTSRVFSHHYVQVPTCGASRCALLRGRYPDQPAHVKNNAVRDTQADWSARSMPALFRQNGYQTLSLGKMTHYPGGMTGEHWADGPEEMPGVWDRAWVPTGPWKTPEGVMHAYANGASRQRGKSPALQGFDGPDEAYPDAWIAADAEVTLKQLAAQDKPWFFAVGFLKPHLPFAAPKKWFDLHTNGVPDLQPIAARKPTWPSGWHGSGEFRGNYSHAGRNPDLDPAYAREIRQAYAASISYVDAQVGRVLQTLRDSGLEKNTIVVVWSDHGFLLGEHAIWGKHCLYEHALRSPLMIRHPGLRQPGKVSTATVETVDIFPTLADLCRLRGPKDLDGRSLRSYLANPNTRSAKPAFAFWSNGQRSVRTDRWRLIVHPGKEKEAPHFELFDYKTDANETRNHAGEQPDVLRTLLTALERVPLPER